MPGKLAGKQIFVSCIFFQHFAEKALGFASVVAVARVIVVNAVAHGIVDDLPGLFEIYILLHAIYRSKPHVAHAQSGDLHPGDFSVVHVIPPLLQKLHRSALEPVDRASDFQSLFNQAPDGSVFLNLFYAVLHIQAGDFEFIRFISCRFQYLIGD